MLLHDRVRDRQAESRALSDLLRREEGIEDPGLHVLRHARPIVVHLEDDGVAVGVVPGAHDERAPAVRRNHRLLGVDHQVQQHLLALVRIGEDVRQAGRERLERGDVVQALLVGAEGQGLADDLIHIDHRARRVPLAGERQQVAHDLRGALRLAEDDVEASLGRLVHGLRCEALGPCQDGRERIVQLVSDAGNRLPQRGQLLRLQQLVIQIARLVLEPFALADVAHQRLDAQPPVR